MCVNNLILGGGGREQNYYDHTPPVAPQKTELDLAKHLHAHAEGMRPFTCFRAKISPSFLFQSEKKEILRRLNQNLKEQSPAVEVESLAPAPAEPCANVQERQSDAVEQPSSNRDRKKWEAAELFVLPVAQQTFEETCSTINGRCKLSIHKVETEAPLLGP